MTIWTSVFFDAMHCRTIFHIIPLPLHKLQPSRMTPRLPDSWSCWIHTFPGPTPIYAFPLDAGTAKPKDLLYLRCSCPWERNGPPCMSFPKGLVTGWDMKVWEDTPGSDEQSKKIGLVTQCATRQQLHICKRHYLFSLQLPERSL